ncbi:tRNA (guanosine(46)-N7)-methyltransferase TrmB [Chiayiivirga flava]|uniref:tRNA (guanine-N(7)-)-methyltransferase n=1 Tax=Chiayiivirga flava TaxID=659595 RepID=A0A7W8G087_9GAMM|nr:tRNA (guanosine(46)-N7)-methyltransferase TrmB [Chiayiivirga flava]MBB5208926.1 tRNA (guanine-N7-)-methyltransferase [Chiayiivirga flava]
MSEATPAPDAASPRRAIRSFVLRQGRLTEAQDRAFELHWPQYGLEPLGTARDFDAVFGRHADRVLEIGFGNGEALRFAAGNEPARDFIGIEVHRPGVGRLLNALADDGASNVRIYNHDAVDVLEHDIADASLDEVRIWFPDPWPKKRHHKRRLVSSTFARLLARKLRVSGLLHLATDWQAYAEHMWDVLDADPQFENEAGPRGWFARPAWRPETHFEARGQRLGHGVWDLLYRRRDPA